MQKRRLGKTGLNVSIVGFGGIPIIGLSRSAAGIVVRHAYEKGVTYFDTSEQYGDSEEKVGAALHDVRDEVVIATKVIRRGSSEARSSLKQSFKALRTNRLDLVQIHNVNGSLNVVKEAKAQGRIDHIGITGHNPRVLVKAIRTGEFDTVLTILNVVERTATEDLIRVANELDVGVITMKALGGWQGSLEYPQRDRRMVSSDPKQDWNPDKSEFIAHFGVDGAERARRSLRYVLAHDITTVIPGFRSAEEIDYAVDVANDFKELTPEEKLRYRFGELPPEPFCRECGSCLPCPEDVMIPTILRFAAYHKFYDIKNWTKDSYPKLMVRADSCTECGKCEERCPYNLPVISMLKETDKTLS
jgi:predicted aldo/keto reductase-like oxidoreductase